MSTLRVGIVRTGVQPATATVGVQTNRGIQGPVGPQGPAGVVASDTPPTNTDVIWVDTSGL